ncbi:mitochondrial sodium hydrogen exchanger 9B2-like [Brachionus plicatilis]|uniref:Mitochondrial sodium hydrogen exchanger 9B2-like n=1 Tax=Brachionus plicatilis TaxID=10195 RepID=A0A3M7R5J1_BRAPC|nr:mitochondrial sodium hydrogen exchanger 9B2-like [Brachionus plicatilis]
MSDQDLKDSKNKVPQKQTNKGFVQKIFHILVIESCFIFNQKLSNKICLFMVISSITWLVLFILFDQAALPGGSYFSIWTLVTCSHVLGFFFQTVKMPSLLGMLITGIVFKNVPVLSIIGSSIDSKTSSLLRNMAFCVILCRAGLSLDIDKLTKMKFKILKFSVIPCLVEAFVFALAAIFILKLSFKWALLMGFVISGVSPAVVVPLMIQLQETGLGVAKNIPGFIIAASCIDNIIAITGHSLMIGIVFNQGEIWWTLLQCPLQILAGLIFGIAVAFFFSIFRLEHKISKVSLRFIVLFLVSLIAALGFKKINYATAGPLAVLTMVIVSKIIWQKVDEHLLNKLTSDQDVVKEKISIDQKKLDEKSFLCISWIPKATVQAAVGSIALDLAKLYHMPLEIPTDILNIAVLSIVATAPIGTILISLSAGKLLQSEQSSVGSSA